VKHSVKAALNGGRTKGDHPAVPYTAEELAAEAAACQAAGAFALHFHARDASGAETIDPAIVNAAAAAVHASSGLPLSVSSAPWIEPDLDRRLAAVRQWTAVDFGGAIFSSEEAIAVMQLYLDMGKPCEAALLSAGDAERWVASGLVDRTLRAVIEPLIDDVAAARAEIAAIHAVLDEAGVATPRLVHGIGGAAWPVAREALAAGYPIRIGFEDVLVGPDGEAVSGNADLVAAARGFSGG
jgi:uncharacterized protein (DUF849 family)